MKCFKRLIKDYIYAVLPPSMDLLQFAYGPNRSTDDAVSQVIHSSLSHLDSWKGSDVRMLFIDFSSAFNTIVPSRNYGGWSPPVLISGNDEKAYLEEVANLSQGCKTRQQPHAEFFQN